MPASCSVVVATHNGSAYIETQIRSILDQSLPPAEILVGDDASRDDTARVVEDVARAHPRGGLVRLILRASPLGVAGNFADLISASTGDVVALADQDDSWDRERLNALLPRFDEANIGVLHHDAQLVDHLGRATGTLFSALRIDDSILRDEESGRGFARLLRRNVATGATMLVRRELATVALPVPKGWIHDEWLAIVAAALGRLSVDRRRLIDYRQHDQNQIGASALTARVAFERFREDGTARNRRLLERARSLSSRLDELLGVPQPYRELARRKVEHEIVRSSLDRRRLHRLRPVVREWSGRGYARFGNGLPDVLRDLIQPRVDP